MDLKKQPEGVTEGSFVTKVRGLWIIFAIAILLSLYALGYDIPAGFFTSGMAQVQVTSTPDQAFIYVNSREKPVGKTNTDIYLIPGTNQITVQKTGYKPMTRQVVVSAGDKAEVDVELLIDPLATHNQQQKANTQTTAFSMLVGVIYLVILMTVAVFARSGRKKQ